MWNSMQTAPAYIESYFHFSLDNPNAILFRNCAPFLNECNNRLRNTFSSLDNRSWNNHTVILTIIGSTHKFVWRRSRWISFTTMGFSVSMKIFRVSEITRGHTHAYIFIVPAGWCSFWLPFVLSPESIHEKCVSHALLPKYADVLLLPTVHTGI